ncbi:helix-turn-helix domain-containing protein [Leptobacterium flavescens]|uniref:Helix-turn-helix domain-containing protein n=2 Tax=Leptobacterium flavescens TaxID=472055 RepID=A0A6P0UPA7_9FLAO|nr:helix-turn-helix domain-containing protein [Leptobacterium flavescens]
MHSPDNYLKDFVETFIYFKDFMPDHSIERVIPTGHIFIIFELDGMERNTFDNDTLKPNNTFRKVWISGMHKNYISISAHQKSEMFVIQFKASGAYPFLHLPVHEINEKIFHAEELLGEEILELREALVRSESEEEKFRLAEDWLNKRFDKEKEPPGDMLDFIHKLQQRSQTVSNNIAALMDEYPYTRKHLIDMFKLYVGLTPKYYHRILRFNEILKQIEEKEKISWAQVSLDCGFSDQAHFIKDFRHFSGFNPKEFIDAGFNNEEKNFFPLDRE